MKKRIPRFKTEEEEREFWAKAKPARFTNFKPSTKTISLRPTESMLDSLKLIANKKDVPYQSLIKISLSERIEEVISV